MRFSVAATKLNYRRYGAFFGQPMDKWSAFWVTLGHHFATFWAAVRSNMFFLRSRMLGEGAEVDLGSPGYPPGKESGTILDASLRHFGHL